MKQDERQVGNQRTGAHYVLMGSVAPTVILMLFLAGIGEMNAFFAIVAFYVAQQLCWIINYGLLNTMITDTSSLLILNSSIVTAAFTILATYLLNQPLLLGLLILSLVLLILGIIRLNKLNQKNY
ncbi:hypothetical protein [Enterococcus alishanensis]|uniref:MFS transporter n=1 Tax=Enterococcus alishanensis TaxID=1303817 RepID=A0ABS6TCK8_9ENTE|nr:hypothetical protein [Enterococcus alishanensis]MBV7390653.1 hypothetical protein [Enterococcus alishanensis]